MSLSVGYFILSVAACVPALGVLCRSTERQPDVGQIVIANNYSNGDTKDSDPEKEGVIYTNMVQGYITRERKKRVASLVAKGVSAVKALLAGTKRLRSQGKNHRRFEKPGNINTALHDFYSVVDKSRGINELRTGNIRILSGYVGNRHVLFKNPGPRARGNPTLDIIDQSSKKTIIPGEDPTSGQYIDRILYKQTDTK